MKNLWLMLLWLNCKTIPDIKKEIAVRQKVLATLDRKGYMVAEKLQTITDKEERSRIISIVSKINDVRYGVYKELKRLERMI